MIAGLADRIKAIEEHIQTMLHSIDYEQPMKQIILGERTHSDDLPAIMIIPGDAVSGGDTIANSPVIKEYWKWSIAVIAIVKSNDVERGRSDVQQLALKAGAAFLQDRTLGGTIDDLIRKTYRPRDRVDLEGETLFVSAMEIELRFTNMEVL